MNTQFAANPVGVEYDPEEWLSQLRGGKPESEFWVRESDEPISPIRGAVAILDAEKPGFEYEGEVAPDAALNPNIMKNYPFSRLTAPANVLVMPGLQSANISAKLLRELGGGTTIGPMLIGMEKPVQIAPMTAIAPDVLTLAVLAAAGVAG